ncbi:MAG: ABC transporter permease [Kiritimatiellae bacterium]|nr:ABC transporter permease [Kiritimatiellia bacterium]
MPIRAWLKNPVVLAFLIAGAMLAFGECLNPGFAKRSQIIEILVVASFLGIAAGGQNLVILGGGGGIDLSVGHVMTLGAILAGNVAMGRDSHTALALLVVVGVTFALGALNGVGVTFFRIPPLVMTLGMAGTIQGAMLHMTRGAKVGRASPFMIELAAGQWVLGIPGILFIWALFALAFFFLLRNTRYGINLYAVGANETVAQLSGVRVGALRVLTYGLSAMIAGLVGFLMLGRTATVYVSLGHRYTLPSIIAVVIGGTALAGGKGGYIGTIAGALILTLLQAILTTMRIEEFGRQIIFGATLIALMFAYGRQRRLRV